MESRPLLRLSFSFTLTKCVVQCEASCSITPKYLIWSDGWMLCPLMRKLRCLVIFFLSRFEYHKLRLTAIYGLFNSSNPFVNKFQVSIYVSAHFFFFFFLSDFSMRSIFVSSAKWCTVLDSTTIWTSLINKMKRRGPRTDPCGTPYFSSLLSDCVLLILVNCEKQPPAVFYGFLEISQNSQENTCARISF